MYPFLIWGGLQVVLKIVDAVISGDSIWKELQLWLPPQGSFAQLWFLPWAVMISAVLSALFWKRTLRFRSHLWAWFAWGGAILASSACLATWYLQDLPMVLRLSLFYMPSVMIGILLFTCREDGRMMIALAAATLIFGLVLRAAGLPGTLQLTLAAPILVAALMIPSPRFRWTSSLATLSMDIYLAHILLLAMVSRVFGLDVQTMAGGFLICLVVFLAVLPLQIPAIGRWFR